MKNLVFLDSVIYALNNYFFKVTEGNLRDQVKKHGISTFLRGCNPAR